MSDLFKDLLNLSQSVARVEQGILVYDGIAEKAKALNGRKLGGIFGYVQYAAVTDMVMAFGRVLSRGPKETSFLSVSRNLNEDLLVGQEYLERYLSERSISFSRNDMVERFKIDFHTFGNPGYDKLRTLRDKLVAHQERGIRSEDIGASFIDASTFVEEAHQKIDACYFGFINRDLTSEPPSKIESWNTQRTSESLRLLLDIVQTVEAPGT